jgi:hypothetical protein
MSYDDSKADESNTEYGRKYDPEPPEILDKVADIVLAYNPKAGKRKKTRKPANQKRRKKR